MESKRVFCVAHVYFVGQGDEEDIKELLTQLRAELVNMQPLGVLGIGPGPGFRWLL